MGINRSSMKRQILLLSALILILAFSAIAQDELKSLRSNVTQVINGKEYWIHTVKKGQSLYMICKAYGVDLNEVIRENPDVKEGLKADQKLRIPTGKVIETPKKTTKKASSEPPEVKPPPPPPPPPEEEVPCGSVKRPDKPLNIALMLPLYLDEVDSIQVNNPPANPEDTYKSLKFIQFYEGFRLAVDSLQKNGFSGKVFVYDVGKDTMKTKKLLRNPDLKNMDLIIGMIYQKNFQMVADFAQKNGIWIVSPLSERSQILANHSRVFKVLPSKESMAGELAAYLAVNNRDAKIFIIRNGQYRDKDADDQAKAACQKENLDVAVTDGYGAAISRLSKENENVLVAFTENKVYALEMLTKLNELKNEYSISVIGLPRWDKIEGLEDDYLVNMKVHIMAPDFVDYQNHEVIKFVNRFTEIYKTDPNSLAFQGFDVGYYFLSALQKYGKNMGRCIREFHTRPLQTDFQFKQTGNNGFENQHWEIYKYDNYRLVRAGK
jgi:ABC-type branched-subunit amino acid transport system substrate-binding protein